MGVNGDVTSTLSLDSSVQSQLVLTGATLSGQKLNRDKLEYSKLSQFCPPVVVCGNCCGISVL